MTCARCTVSKVLWTVVLQIHIVYFSLILSKYFLNSIATTVLEPREIVKLELDDTCKYGHYHTVEVTV